CSSAHCPRACYGWSEPSSIACAIAERESQPVIREWLGSGAVFSIHESPVTIHTLATHGSFTAFSRGPSRSANRIVAGAERDRHRGRAGTRRGSPVEPAAFSQGRR